VRILGIDPGTATTGFGIIESHGSKLKFVDAGVITTLPVDRMADRLGILHRELTEIITEYQPDQISVELLYFATNVTTAISVGQARGVVLLCAGMAQVPIGEYTPLQVKQAVTGYGKAGKRQVQEMVQSLLGLNDIPKPDDAADALAIAITHASQVRSAI
jgi:crossover junction endodeoxyribonuclease RuvC